MHKSTGTGDVHADMSGHKSLKERLVRLGVALAISAVVIIVGMQFYPEYAAIEKGPAIITLMILGCSVGFFFTEAIPLAVTAMLIPVFMVLTGVVAPKAAFSGLANDTVVLFGGMFIVGGALFATGVAKAMGDFVVKISKGNQHVMMIGMMIITGVLSSVLSNTSTVAVLLPVCVAIADSGKFSRAKLLLPVAMLASAGGMISLVGTPPNGTVQQVLTENGFAGMGFFEFAWIGVPVSVALTIFIALVGHKLLPNKTVSEQTMSLDDIDQIDFHNMDRSKAVIAVIIMSITIVVMFLEIIPTHAAAVAGAMACIIFGCIDEKEAYHSIDWVTIFLFAGTLSLASAMASTGAGAMIADAVIALMAGNQNPIVLMSILFVVAAGLTQFMSNTATAALLCPIGLAIATQIGADPRAIVLGIGIACSAAYCTPMATPPNTLVLGPCNLGFGDYAKFGLPLLVITYILVVLILPVVWPMFPA